MSWLSDLIDTSLALAQKFVPANAKVEIAGTTVTADELMSATGSLGTFFSAFAAAVKAKSIETGAELSIEEIVSLAAALGFGEPFTGIAKMVLPLVFGAFNALAATPLVAVDGGWGGFVTEAWAKDPREQLNPDGSFKN